MKHVIGIININYECAATLPNAFKAWKEVKEGLLGDMVDSVYISSSHQVFPETFASGFPIQSQDDTFKILNEFYSDGVIDNFIFYTQPVHEADAWTDRIKDLPKDVTTVFMINSDEIWRADEIAKALSYIDRNPYIDWFKVNFKNYFGQSKWVGDFQVPRIWRNDRNGGVKASYRDDLMSFGNGKKDVELSNAVIPANLVRPAHYSWHMSPNATYEANKRFVHRKLAFQKLRYHTSSYRWNDEIDELELNPDYYRMIGKPIPEVHYEEIPNT